MPDYPGVDIPDDIQWRSTTLYSICGWFASADFGHAATAFGGFIRLDEEDRTIEGCSVDTWGSAVIKGVWEGNTLTFQKSYVQFSNIATAQNKIYYTLVLDGNTWKGLYKFGEDSRIISGKVACKIMPAVTDAFAMVCGFPR